MSKKKKKNESFKMLECAKKKKKTNYKPEYIKNKLVLL